MNHLCKQLNIQYPIFQGGMAWIAEHHLASAVSEAGALGIIAAGNAPADIVREQIRAMKQKTNKPFAVNMMLLSPHADDIAKMLIEEGVKIVTTGAGSPGKYMEDWKKNGITVIPVVPSIALAKRLEREGADALIVEGCEAGGHIGELTTMALVPQIVDIVNIPVIAAGGIADGRGMAAAMMLGASGVQIGTRFLVANECQVHANYKQKILKASDIDTVVTGRSTGHPVRGMRNALTRQYQKLEKQGVSVHELEELGKGALQKAAIEGDTMNGAVMAGQIAGLVNKEQSAKSIIEEIINESKQVIERIYSQTK